MVNLAYRDGDTGIKENVCKRLTPPVIDEDEEELLGGHPSPQSRGWYQDDSKIFTACRLSAMQIYTRDDDVEILRDATEKINAALK